MEIIPESIDTTVPWSNPERMLGEGLITAPAIVHELDSEATGNRWIQRHAPAALGDLVSLSRLAERAESDRQNLEWVIEQQRRQAAGERPGAASGGSDGQDDTRWLWRLLPSAWISTLKSNREWVAAGGVSLLVIVWFATTFSRGSLPPPSVRPVDTVKPPVRKRRRHRERSATSPN